MTAGVDGRANSSGVGGAGGRANPAGAGGGTTAPSATVLDFYPLAISGDGSVVVGTPELLYHRVARWTASTGTQVIPGIAGFTLKAISADGTTIVGQADSNGGPRASRIAEATLTTIDPGTIPSSRSWVVAVSDDGGVIVGTVADNGDGEQAFRWTLAGGFAGLGFLPGDVASAVESMSPDGRTIVGLSFDATGKRSRPFRWTESQGMLEIPTVATSSLTFPLAVNDAGTVLAYSYTGGNVSRDTISWTGTIGIDTAVLAPGAPARLITGCGTMTSAPVAVAANGTLLLKCPPASLLLVTPGGAERLLSLPAPPPGYTANDQWISSVGLSQDGSEVVGRYDLGQGRDNPRSIVAWSESSSSPSLVLSRLRGTPGDVDLLNPDVQMMSADGSTIVGGTMYGPTWLLRLR